MCFSYYGNKYLFLIKTLYNKSPVYKADRTLLPQALALETVDPTKGKTPFLN